MVDDEELGLPDKALVVEIVTFEDCVTAVVFGLLAEDCFDDPPKSGSDVVKLR